MLKKGKLGLLAVSNVSLVLTYTQELIRETHYNVNCCLTINIDLSAFNYSIKKRGIFH